MKKMAEHLLKRDGIYYYNRRVPDDVRAAFPKSVVKFSLQTSSLKEAKARRNVADVEWDAKFERLGAKGGEQGAPPAGSQASRQADPTELVRQYVATMQARMTREHQQRSSLQRGRAS
jgi:hypothetical protein